MTFIVPSRPREFLQLSHLQQFVSSFSNDFNHPISRPIGLESLPAPSSIADVNSCVEVESAFPEHERFSEEKVDTVLIPLTHRTPRQYELHLPSQPKPLNYVSAYSSSGACLDPRVAVPCQCRSLYQVPVEISIRRGVLCANFESSPNDSDSSR